MNFSFDYNVDMVFCIDATGSMGGLIDKVKNNALNFYQDVQKMMTNKQKKIAQLRVRVIAFRDYAADGDDAMMVTDFFNLPAEEKDFEETVKSIRAEGGGDIPEDGLEALAYAIRSDWNNAGTKRRHVIVVWTDAPTHEMGYAQLSQRYAYQPAGTDSVVGRCRYTGKRLYGSERQAAGSLCPGRRILVSDHGFVG